MLAAGICMTLLYGLFVVLAQPGITISFARDERIGSGLDFGAVWEWSLRNPGRIVVVVLAAGVIGAVLGAAASAIGALLCGIGLLATVPLATVVSSLVQFHLYGQLAASDPLTSTPQ
jgi:uncharacterized membrane protein